MHIFQVGAGSGGMVVLDLLCRDDRVKALTLVEPDDYKPHNVVRHYFPPSAVGGNKATLAARWVAERRPDIRIRTLIVDLLDPNFRSRFAECVAECDIGVCAVDNEPAKFRFDSLMRTAGKPWTLGEVLSGGIGGWVHRFTPGGACYGCVASHLRREIPTDNSPPPDYSAPGGPVHETTIPASKASINAIASLHACATLDLFEGLPTGGDFTSLLMTLKRVPGVFDEAYRPHRFRIARNPDCLICRPVAETPPKEDLDVALDQALARLGGE